MSIADWFKARESSRYTPVTGDGSKTDVPEGVWAKCASCNHIVYEGELTENARVCPYCSHHFDLTAHDRIDTLADEDSFEEIDTALTSSDALGFVDSKPYPERLEAAKERSGLPEALVVGRATMDGHSVIIAAMDFRFIGASMGSVVGEKVTRAFETALAERRAIVIATASGGARMQEGMLSLMQMAKTSAAAARLADAGLPYISILTNPTYGGVTASFAVLADVVLAEPGAIIGFTGQRIIEQTIRQKLPKGFQTSEFLLEHGMIDEVVPRSELKQQISLLLDYLYVGGEAS